MSTTPDQPKFEVGDKVHFMNVRNSGRGFNMSRREGTIIRLLSHHAEIKLKNGRTTVEDLADLRKDGERGHLEDVMSVMAGKKV